MVASTPVCSPMPRTVTGALMVCCLSFIFSMLLAISCWLIAPQILVSRGYQRKAIGQ